MRKKVLMILDSTYPSDVRVEKEISALKELYDITLFCSKDSVELNIDGINQIKKGPSTKNLKKGIREILISIFSLDPIMYFSLRGIIKKNDFDIIHVHDLPQFATVNKALSKQNKTIILDLHENYPEALSTWFAWRKSKLINIKNQLFFRFHKWKCLEFRAIKNATHIIAVVEEMKFKILNENSINQKKVSVISNVESKSFQSRSKRRPPFLSENTFNIVYLGGIGPHRGLDDVIKAIRVLLNDNINLKIHLHVFGNGHRDNIEFLNSLMRDLKLDTYVSFHPPVPFTEVPLIMSFADLNIIPHKSNGHCDNTVPHKLFQAMLSKRPLLVSSSAPLKRIIADGELGYWFTAGDPTSLAQEIIRIQESQDEAYQKAIKAHDKCFYQNLNWEHESTKLVELYNNLSKNVPSNRKH